MLTKSDVINALNALSDFNTLQQAITGLQRNHSPKHLEVTHIRQNAGGYGSSFFMKKNPLTQTVTKLVWGKPVSGQAVVPGQFSEAFGDYTDIDRNDERTIINHLLTSDSVGYALNIGNINRFLIFSDVPQPYVGFDWVANQCLPVEAGYLAIVIEKTHNSWKIITAFPCARAYYQRYQTSVLHK
ncbi:MAG: hypothetical protein GQ582_04505 [Methyloprofundus sp.]|nr:hypothetical protein [Methyloprofundus sp.]